MTSLLPNFNEWQLQLNFIDEAMRLFGIEAKIYKAKTITMYSDGVVPTEYFFNVRILLEEYVSKRLLANLKWQQKEDGQEGMVAFIPRQYGGEEIAVQRDNILEFNDEKFIIAEVNKKYITGLWYVVQIVPYQPEEDRKIEGHKSSYLKTDREEIE